MEDSPRQISKISALKKHLKPEQIQKRSMDDKNEYLPSAYRKIINQSDQAFLSKYATPNLSPRKDLQKNDPLQFSYDFGGKEFKNRIPKTDNCVLRIKKVSKNSGIFASYNADLTSDCVENVVAQNNKAVLRESSHVYRFQEKIRTKQVIVR